MLDDANGLCDEEQEGSSVYSAETVSYASFILRINANTIYSIWNIKASPHQEQMTPMNNSIRPPIISVNLLAARHSMGHKTSQSA